MKYLFDRLCQEQRSYFDFYFDQVIGENTYYIGIAFTHLWSNEPIIITYADDNKTIEHGSLADGIMKGIIRASKEIAGAEALHEYDFTIRRLKRYKNFVLLAYVRGNGYNYHGSTYYKLDEPMVKKEAAEITYQECLSYMQRNKEKAIQTIKWLFWKM